MRIIKTVSFVLLLIFSSCTQIKPRVELLNYGLPKSKKQLVICTDLKRAEFGIAFFTKIVFTFTVGGERINEISLYTDDDTLLWNITAKDDIVTVNPIIYGEINKNYNQIFPVSIDDVAPLIIENRYKIVIVFDGGSIEKQFTFYPSTIYLNWNDVKE